MLIIKKKIELDVPFSFQRQAKTKSTVSSIIIIFYDNYYQNNTFYPKQSILYTVSRASPISGPTFTINVRAGVKLQ